eukprot:SAG31_NODE_1544_length_7943_cov_4.076237_3_plen_182_part_00
MHGLSVGKTYVFRVTTRQIDGRWAEYTTKSVPVAPEAPRQAEGALALDPSQAERAMRQAELRLLDSSTANNKISPQKHGKIVFESAEKEAAAAEEAEEAARKIVIQKAELAKWAAEQRQANAAERREKALAEAAAQRLLAQETEAEVQRAELAKKIKWAETNRNERKREAEEAAGAHHFYA